MKIFLEKTILALLYLNVLVKRKLTEIGRKKEYKWGNTGENI